MELNREQIIKELEGLVNFITCPEYIKDALSLIKELTEDNVYDLSAKELTEKCENLSIELEAMRGAANSYKMHNKKLTEDNEWCAKRILEADKKVAELTEELAEANKLLNMHRFLASDNGTTYVIPSVRSIKAEVVKQMQTEIESRCIKGGIYPAFVASTIDQIAKEMQDQEVDNGRETAKC